MYIPLEDIPLPLRQWIDFYDLMPRQDEHYRCPKNLDHRVRVYPEKRILYCPVCCQAFGPTWFAKRFSNAQARVSIMKKTH